MLRTYLHMVPVLLRARLGRSHNIGRLHQRVRLSQIDLNQHMNQARYADVMELGRAEWLVRSGAWQQWRAAGVNPVVANQRLEYRRELKPLQRYLIDTRALAVEGRLLHVQSHLIVGDRVHALGDVRLIFLGPAGVLSADEVQPLCDGLLAPPLAVTDWRVT